MCEELNEMIYGGDEEVKREIEVDERFAMYKGQDGPKAPKDNDVTDVEVENPPVQIEGEPEEVAAPPAEPKAAVPAADAETEPATVEVTVELKPQSIQFCVLGMDNAGKSSIVNMLQGKGHVKTKPTIGFRPTSMMLDENTTVRFYDIGGGKKIRDIWGQYYHDAHAVIYVVDLSEKDETRLQDSKALFSATISHPFMTGKPLLVLGNKSDVDGGMSIDDLSAFLDLPAVSANNNNVSISACSAALMATEDEAIDDRIETTLENLIGTVQDNFASLNDRVIVDTKAKAKEDQKKRLARERTVLKNKIILAFHEDVLEEFKPDEADKKKINPEDQFTVEEGLTFLGAELGEEVAALPAKALEVAAMTGYQRLALQIVGSLKVPISKKKEPMTWEEIYALVLEIRVELGLSSQ
jgi:small GTP-binding protein